MSARRPRLGSPPERLETIAALQEEGVHTWWFEGDRAAARESFRRRGTAPLEAWHAQVPKIECHWRRIEEMYGSRMIRTLDANGRYTDPEELAGPILEGARPRRAGHAR